MQNEDLPYLPYWMNQTFFYFCGTFGGHPPQPAGGVKSPAGGQPRPQAQPGTLPPRVYTSRKKISCKHDKVIDIIV